MPDVTSAAGLFSAPSAGAAERERHRQWNLWMIAASVMIATFMVVLDFSVGCLALLCVPLAFLFRGVSRKSRARHDAIGE